MKIAVLLTTYNRRDKTVACINSLKAQHNLGDIELTVFLTDDNSADNTVEAVTEIFPDARILRGSGSLFWAGGMRSSWNEALKSQFDFYLLLNDDTVLANHTLRTLVNSYQTVYKQTQNEAIIVGSTSEFGESKVISYGGKKLTSKYDIKYATAFSETEIVACDLGNANIMLVPHAIVNKIGILSTVYTHGIADYDYTLQAKRNKFGVYVAPGVLGHCIDDHGNNWKSSQNSTLKERITFLKSPKGLAYHEHLHLIKTFFPLSLPMAFVKLWLKTLFPFLWDKFKTTH
ncbi:glycosyltransferase family 2 protein [Pedobacter endophyticus]|uniref:Glycosyltransferase family 2 protein n=1 Tax=Pedobacter endophyticus TaxID=2789740 RepID=A0A7S9PZR5_9SPHI|nr:glycosyltransferase [Pedobacter endophyticus]QPH39937.1 glycosyltransferase family 2 protein [Pedobacter endophyticus]